MATYKTKDGSKTGFVPGVGEIVDGYLRNAPKGLESPNLELVPDPEQSASTAAPAQPTVAPATPSTPENKPAAPSVPPQTQTPKKEIE